MSRKNFKGGFDALLGNDVASIELESAGETKLKNLKEKANIETRA